MRDQPGMYWQEGITVNRINVIRGQIIWCLTLCLFLMMSPVAADQGNGFTDDNRTEREMVQALEAYAVYKMGQYEEAFDRFYALAEVNNVQGMLNVANMYAAGVGVAENQIEATRWYARAANLGSVIAMEEYATRLGQGTGVQQDNGASAFWRNKIQSVAGAELPLTTTMISLNHAIPLIENKLKEFDMAAMNQSADGVVEWVSDDSSLLAVLPGTRHWTAINKLQLSALWQAGFDRPGNYTYQRSATEHTATEDGRIHTRFSVLEEWREEEGDAAVQQRIVINNNLLLEFSNNAMRVHQWKLHIRQSQ